MKYLNYNKQKISAEDIKSVIKVLRSERITQGKFINIFEKKLNRYFGSKHALAISNATSALFLIGKILKWKKNDHVILSPLTFVSGANSVLFSGATPVFVDVNRNDQNLDPVLVEKKIKELKIKKKKVKAIIITDYAGNPADWKYFRKIKKRNNLILINDNCHALGASYYNDKKYAMKFSDFVVHSYHAVKNITTAEGGAIFIKNSDNFKKLRILREHGFEQNDKRNPFNYNLKQIGFNFRLSDLNCGLGISQLSRIDSIIKKRDYYSKFYDKYFINNNLVETPKREKNKKSSYHLYNIRINFDKLNISKLKFFKIMKKKYKINLQVHYTPTYKFSLYKKYLSSLKDFQNTEEYYKQTFSLPLYLDLSKKNIKYVANSINYLTKKYNNV